MKQVLEWVAMSVAEQTPRAHFGLIGFCIGICAIVAAGLLTADLFQPAPEKSIGTTIGEIARDIRNAATGASSEVEAHPTGAAFDFTSILMVLTPILAGVAAVLGGTALFRREPTSLGTLAIGLGVGAVLLQYAFWLALLICGTVLLVSIVSNFGDILGG